MWLDLEEGILAEFAAATPSRRDPAIISLSKTQARISDRRNHSTYWPRTLGPEFHVPPAPKNTTSAKHVCGTHVRPIVPGCHMINAWRARDCAVQLGTVDPRSVWLALGRSVFTLGQVREWLRPSFDWDPDLAVTVSEAAE